jgi:hypothetical protein
MSFLKKDQNAIEKTKRGRNGVKKEEGRGISTHQKSLSVFSRRYLNL